MRPFYEIARTMPGVLMFSFALLLLFAQIRQFAAALSNKRRKRPLLFAGLHLLCGGVLLTLLLDGVYALDYLPYERGYSPPVSFLGEIPWLVYAALEALSAVIVTVSIVKDLKNAHRTVSPQSIKEALDFLPVGVCIGAEDGSVLLSNIKMNETAELLTGGALSDFGVLNAAVGAGGEENGRYPVKKDGRVFVFERSGLLYNGKACTELIAEEQTGQYRAIEELEEKTARLRDLQYRLKAFRVREEDLMTKQEILQARTTIHRELGGALLTGKYYFEHPDKVDEKELLTLMRQINDYLLGEIEAPEDRGDEVEAALKMARGIGVTVDLSGSVPKEEPFYSLVGQAIAECASNTVKHAGGDRLTVKIDEDGRRATFTGSGAPPAKRIVETGGLLSLRRACEKAGATMTVKSAPAFEVTIERP